MTSRENTFQSSTGSENISFPAVLKCQGIQRKYLMPRHSAAFHRELQHMFDTFESSDEK